MKIKYKHIFAPTEERICDTEKTLRGSFAFACGVCPAERQAAWDKAELARFEADRKKGIILSYSVCGDESTKKEKKIYSAAEWARQQYTDRWGDNPWNRSRVEAGDVPAAYIGRRTIMVGSTGGCTLLTEGFHFFVDDEEGRTYIQNPELNILPHDWAAGKVR